MLQVTLLTVFYSLYSNKMLEGDTVV